MFQSLCIIILLFGRVINLAIPLTLGELIRVFDGRSELSPWPLLFGYVALRFLQGSGGLAAIRDVINPLLPIYISQLADILSSRFGLL